jgi:hypothetical protein
MWRRGRNRHRLMTCPDGDFVSVESGRTSTEQREDGCCRQLSMQGQLVDDAWEAMEAAERAAGANAEFRPVVIDNDVVTRPASEVSETRPQLPRPSPWQGAWLRTGTHHHP